LRKYTNRSAGFGLTEVLISVVIVSIGLLGLTSLQNHSIKSLQEGDNLVMASMIAKEMAQRMMSNRYVTAQGRQGYLATDLSGAIATDGGVLAWASDVLSSKPDITNCYAANNSYSCFAPGGSLSSHSDHQTALYNMQAMDEVELRTLAWNILPQGQIHICFDTAGPYTSWACNNVSSRVSATNGNSLITNVSENVFTIKVLWNNIFTNSTQMYALQFTAECDDGSSTYCG
jgi:type IV pilus modification protein PilV